MRPSIAVAAAAVALALPAGALAHEQGAAFDLAIAGLKQANVYVEPGPVALSELEADAVHRRLIEAEDVYLAVLDAVVTDVRHAATELREEVGRPGTYLLLAGTELAGASTDIEPAELERLLGPVRAPSPLPLSVRLIALADRIEEVAPSGGGGLGGAVLAGVIGGPLAVLAVITAVLLRRRLRTR